jgi:TATA-box binding protein (TBP) (component of TFIID and TFIIIB)
MEEGDSNEEEEEGSLGGGGGGSKVSDQQQKELRKKRIYTPLNVSKKSNKRSKTSSSSSTPTPTIHNIVSTSKIVCISLDDMQERSVDLDEVFELIHCSHYNRKKFAAITIRIDDPTVTALLFTSGRLVITGSKSWYECMLASLVIVGMLRKVQPSCHLEVRDCEIQNVVANVIIPGSTPEIPLDARLNINAMLLHLNASVKVMCVCVCLSLSLHYNADIYIYIYISTGTRVPVSKASVPWTRLSTSRFPSGGPLLRQWQVRHHRWKNNG